MSQTNGAAAAPINLVPVGVEGAPVVKLAGLDFPIPVLAIKQNRIVVPGLMKLAPFLVKFGELAATAKTIANPDGDPAWWHKIEIETHQLDLMSDIVYSACTRAKPGFGRGEFDNMPITLMELIEAIGVIGAQTGMMGRRREGVPGSGETMPAPASGQVPDEVMVKLSTST